jgi:hypothetical protein
MIGPSNEKVTILTSTSSPIVPLSLQLPPLQVPALSPSTSYTQLPTPPPSPLPLPITAAVTAKKLRSKSLKGTPPFDSHSATCTYMHV